MKDELQFLIYDNPIIAAVTNEIQLEKALESQCDIISLIYGDICTLPDIVERVKDHGKTAFVYLDLINGISPRDVAVDYIVRYTKTDGIISTKPNVIKRAKAKGLITVMRAFLCDSIALENMKKDVLPCFPDMIEILPGIVPRITKAVAQMTKIPIISGGFVRTKDEVVDQLNAGASCVSTSSEYIWNML